MGAIKTKTLELESIIHESIDLFEQRVDLTIRGNTFYLSSECQTVDLLVVPFVMGSCESGRQGPALVTRLQSLDEYSFCELVEQASRGGYTTLFVEVSNYELH